MSGLLELARRVPWWAWLIAPIALLLWWGRDTIAEGVEAGAAAVRKGAKMIGVFASIPALLPYFNAAAEKYAHDVADLIAIGMRESGLGLYLRPKGASGTGDWTARRAGMYAGKPVAGRLKTYQTRAELPAGWLVAANSIGPYCIPDDGQGWGRGLMQIDFCDSWILNGGDWKDPQTNIMKGGEVLAAKRKALSGKASGAALRAAAIAAYNTGEGNVGRSLAAGKDVDSTTTGKDYSAAVLKKSAEVRSVLA